MPFAAKRVSRSFVQHLDADPARVFPLLCPVREREWVPGWDADIVFSASGVAETGCVFTTRRDGEPDTTWLVVEYEPDRRIAFAQFTPGERVAHITIDLAEHEGRTHATVQYTFVGLSDAGNAFVDAYTEEAYLEKMHGWERALNHYLTTGTLIGE